ncbi:MAG: 2-hydroxyacyl-CoA dehydratase family protein [Synergistaceae bacterium]|nr:2-hydroxyacyl-CoA dehydratase family protein [Synergistaceae bacterium]
MTSGVTNARNERIFKKTSDQISSETARVLETLRSRADYTREFDYFLELAESGMTPEAAETRTGLTTIKLLCVQAPLELIHAAGFHPFKVFCGSNAACNLASRGLPALACPMLRSVIGAAKLAQSSSESPWVLPTTCDWVVKFPEMLAISDVAGEPDSIRVHWLELPHLKDRDDGQRRWIEEIYNFKKFLTSDGRRIKRAALAESVAIYRRAWQALVRLSDLRREGRLSSIWFMLMTGVFFCDSPQNWTTAAERAANSQMTPALRGAKVFLAGSPIFFPNFKIPFLLEEAGLEVVSDDLCSSERIFPGSVACGDESEFGLMSAMSQSYHQGCVCPTFIDNDRRINNILGRMKGAGFKGVVFHVLKGCHPYDLESFGIETKLKDRGLKFIRLETDYSGEDSRNLNTRLEAFRQTIRED